MELSQKTKNRATIWPSNSTPGYMSKKPTKTLIWKDICTPMFISALFTIAKIWKQLKCPSTDEWMKKMWYTHTNTQTHTMEYYSDIKREQILPFAATWMDLVDIILSEISQTKKNTVWYHLNVESKIYNKLVNITKKQIHGYREQISVASGEGGRDNIVVRSVRSKYLM